MGVQAGGAGAKVDSIVVGQMASEVDPESCVDYQRKYEVTLSLIQDAEKSINR